MDKEVAVGMCQATWKVVLAALSQLLARSSSEEIILHLLKVTVHLLLHGSTEAVLGCGSVMVTPDPIQTLVAVVLLSADTFGFLYLPSSATVPSLG